MSDTQADSPGPRRSQRERKVVKPFASASTGGSRKRKRNESDTEGDASQDAEHDGLNQQESEAENDANDEDEGYKAPKPKEPGSARKTKAKTSPKSKSAPAAKKPRAEKAAIRKIPKVAARRGRRPKEGEDAYDPDQVAKDTKISSDNPLFNAIMNPASPLQSSAEDFLESLQQSPEAALAELINLVLRSCGCNDSVDADQVVDFDGIVSALDDFTEVLKQENSPVYPLTSKLPVFKRFRKSLSEWIERLIISASDLGLLYSSQLMETLQQWVVSMSSSQIRSFRHTATVIALEAETALCDVAAAVDKEKDVVSRQREGEKKRKTKGTNPRLQELILKEKEVKRRQAKLTSFIKEFVDGVFIHRFRDLDPSIRAECVRSLGLWLRKYPDYFLVDARYLRYVGWVLSDSNNHVRLEAVKSLSGAYEQVDHILALTNFTERFKARLLEMATSDIDLSIRVATIQVLADIEGHFTLEDEEKEKLCLLLFDEEPKVRRAVSSFVRGVWEDEVAARLNTQDKPSDKDKQRIGVKALAVLLVKWGKALDTLSGDVEESEMGDAAEEDAVNGRPRANRRREVIALVGAEGQGRVALAVESLWEGLEPVSDWEGLLELLLLDHSASEEDNQLTSSPRPRVRANGKKHTDDFVVDEAWRLEEVEESTLLEVLVAAIRTAKAESVGGRKDEEENVSNDITRALIKGLPRLFIKHQSDQNRIAEVLVIPTLMNLDLYLEMRMITAYSSLWDDVIKQFMSHSSAKVLSHAMVAIQYFMKATSLSNTNSTKILELEDELSTQLRDTIAGRDEIEIATFTEDEVLALIAWCTRLSTVTGARNMTAWIEEDEGGKQSSAWDIINALVERGRLGYKEEEMMVEQALNVLNLHVLWKSKGLSAENDPTPEDIRCKEVLQEQRDALLEKLVEFAVGTQSNTVEGVKRAAFKHLLDLHVVFCSAEAYSDDGAPRPAASLALTLDDELQYRCAGYIQAEIERYAEFLEDEDEEEKSRKSDAGSSEEEQEDARADEGDKPAKSPRAKKSHQEADLGSRDVLEREHLFLDVLSTFLRAIQAGAIHIKHGAVVLAHYGRLGVAFDMCSKKIVELLREEHMLKDNPTTVVATITQAIQESSSLVVDGVVRDETNAVQLAKLLSTCFVVRGNQLSVLRRLGTEYVVQVQTNLLSWVSKRIATYEKNKNKRGLKTAIALLRVLIPLLSAVPSRDALKIKAHMGQVLEEAQVEVSATSKVWEPHRAYEKRLSAIMSKDNAHAPKVKKSRKKGAAAGSSGEDTDGERTNDEEPAAEHVARPQRPRRSTRSKRATAADEGTGDDEVEATPKARPRPRPRANYRRKSPSPSKESPAPEPEPSPPASPMEPLTPMDDSEPEPEPEPTTPKPASRKRARTEDEESDGNEPAPNGIAPAASAQQSESGGGEVDIQVRRKRIRH
ncbi:unnamed protein product [Cyclocybe aegerita]|uniref:SCD domain-containing protein n=1 Tax=Cyclocybe aegerita TaxID=1973307 RepID=A0A8S0X7T2_CYCAE|nr:unnamed protein product [Cyclocybe aegerita]